MSKSMQEQLAAISGIMGKAKAMSPMEMCNQIIECADRGVLGHKINVSMFRSIREQMDRGRNLSAKQIQAIENTYTGYRVGEKY